MYVKENMFSPWYANISIGGWKSEKTLLNGYNFLTNVFLSPMAFLKSRGNSTSFGTGINSIRLNTSESERNILKRLVLDKILPAGNC